MGLTHGAGRGKIAALDAFLDEYADDVEADLAALDVDLLDLYRGGLSYRRLGVLVERLPAESATKTAVRERLDDDDVPVAEPAGHGPWSHTDLLLASVLDALHVLAWQNTQIHGSKRTSPPEPVRRPGLVKRRPQISEAGVAYLTEMRERRRRAQHGDSGR